MNKAKASLEERVVRAAEAAFATRSFVSAIDVFVGIGWLPYVLVENWRRGRLEYLLDAMQVRTESISAALRILREWAVAKGLRASEMRYTRMARGTEHELRFTPGGEDVERVLRTHFVAGELSEKTQEKLREKVEKPAGPVVFLIRRDTACSECGVELGQGSFLTMDGEQALCLACGGLGDLMFLPAGDATLTRRAGKYSSRSAVVVEFRRSRGRYERQGMLVEEEALAKAEAECIADAEDRARERAAAAKARVKEDARFVTRFAERIRELYPRCPEEDVLKIAEHTAQRGSGRVGRSAAGRELQENAVELAVRAYVRHALTDYDELLGHGIGREEARARVRDSVNHTLERMAGTE